MTFVPAQIVVAEDAMEIVGVTMFDTFIVIVLLVAATPFTQGELLVTTQLIVVPFVKAALL